MLAILATLFVVFYVYAPGVLFSKTFSLFIPLKKFQRSNTQEIAFALTASIFPLLLAALLTFHFAEVDLDVYGTLLSGLHSTEWFAKNETEFWNAFTIASSHQCLLLPSYYVLVVIEGTLAGLLCSHYGKLQCFKLYKKAANRFLLPTLSEWHVLLTQFAYPDSRVIADVLTVEDHLYSGLAAEYFTDLQGDLSGILLTEARQFQRNEYLQDKKDGKQRDKAQYWRVIPGARLYIFADKIIDINLSYKPTANDYLQALKQQRIVTELKQFKIVPEVVIQESPQTPAADSATSKPPTR